MIFRPYSSTYSSTAVDVLFQDLSVFNRSIEICQLLVAPWVSGSVPLSRCRTMPTILHTGNHTLSEKDKIWHTPFFCFQRDTVVVFGGMSFFLLGNAFFCLETLYFGARTVTAVEKVFPWRKHTSCCKIYAEISCWNGSVLSVRVITILPPFPFPSLDQPTGN